MPPINPTAPMGGNPSDFSPQKFFVPQQFQQTPPTLTADEEGDWWVGVQQLGAVAVGVVVLFTSQFNPVYRYQSDELRPVVVEEEAPPQSQARFVPIGLSAGQPWQWDQGELPQTVTASILDEEQSVPVPSASPSPLYTTQFALYEPDERPTPPAAVVDDESNLSTFAIPGLIVYPQLQPYLFESGERAVTPFEEDSPQQFQSVSAPIAVYSRLPYLFDDGERGFAAVVTTGFVSWIAEDDA